MSDKEYTVIEIVDVLRRLATGDSITLCVNIDETPSLR
jgi:hypothetical protein